VTGYFHTWLHAVEFPIRLRYDLMPQAEGSAYKPLFATAHTGGSVQHGLSAAGGVDGFFEHCSAADKR